MGVMDDILKQIKKDIKNNPEKFTSQNLGKIIETECPKCEEERKLEIIKEGKVKCLTCGEEMDLNISEVE
jgi:PHP family Zn ribbon phosphoesterase